MKLHQTMNATRIEVICDHPDHSSRCYTFVIEESEEEFFSSREDGYEKEIRKAIEEKVNPYGFWHEVKIILVTPIDHREYLKEI